jgi:hypothetical protein
MCVIVSICALIALQREDELKKPLANGVPPEAKQTLANTNQFNPIFAPQIEVSPRINIPPQIDATITSQ